MNEWYAKDISKKIRSTRQIKGNSGEPLGVPPYGYTRNPNNKKHWIADEVAADIVRRIFTLTLEGMGPGAIATSLEKKGFTSRAFTVSLLVLANQLKGER